MANWENRPVQEMDIAFQLADYLTKGDRYGNHQGRSILKEKTERYITSMANEIAFEIVSGNPKLKEIIRARVAEIVATALRDDTYLNDVISTAVGKALGQLVASNDESVNDE